MQHVIILDALTEVEEVLRSLVEVDTLVGKAHIQNVTLVEV